MIETSFADHGGAPGGLPDGWGACRCRFGSSASRSQLPSPGVGADGPVFSPSPGVGADGSCG
ncbi:MAG: hypothetical protein ACYCW5_00535 [Thermoleophilia bacterium]